MVVHFLLWSVEREQWWRPGALGYTSDVRLAGRFTASEAQDFALSAAYAGRIEKGLVIVAAPEVWRQGERDGN